VEGKCRAGVKSMTVEEGMVGKVRNWERGIKGKEVGENCNLKMTAVEWVISGTWQ